MGKNKLARWAELESYRNVIQPPVSSLGTPGREISLIRPADGDTGVKDHAIKGRWRSEIFLNTNPVVLELGCGRGEYTIGLAKRFPEKNFIGVDIKGARLWKGAKTSNDEKISNTAFLRTRIEFINSFFAADEADEIWITFPDPHPGTRNSNKRLTSPWYLNRYRSLLRDRGIIHLKTDNTELFSYTLRTVRHNSLQLLSSTPDLYGSNIPDDILSIRTHYEDLFLKTGMKICYLSFILEKEKLIEDETQRKKA